MRKGKLFTGKAWKRMVRILSCIVVFCTTYALILPAITQEAQAYCGNSEHKHTEKCYKEILSCTREEHVHSEDCFDADGSLICTLEEHTHSDECFRELLECTEEEHTHSLECFSDPEADKETEEDWKKTLPDEEALKDKSDTEKVLMIAESQKGYKESEKNYVVENETEKKGITRYGQWDEDPYEDWAGAYARFVLHYAGIETADAKKHTSDWLEQLHDKGELKAAEEAEAGDVLFVYDDKDQLKAGIVSEVKDGTVKAWMGDWDNQVQEKTFSKTDVNVHSVWKAIQKEEPANSEQPEEPTDPEVPTEDEQKPEEDPKADEEKPAEERKDEETVVTYDFTQEVEAEDGAKIKVSWNAGTFETEDLVFQAKKVELTEEEQKKVQEQLDKDKNYTFRNYDLTFYVRDENMELQKVEPMQPVHVEIEFGKNVPDEDDQLPVFHITESGEIESLKRNLDTTKNNHNVRFEANSFTVYSVPTNDEGIEVQYYDQDGWTIVGSTDELRDALNDGKKQIRLSSHFYGRYGFNFSDKHGLVIDLNGYNISSDYVVFNISNSDIKFTNSSTTQSYITCAVDKDANGLPVFNIDKSNVTLEGITVEKCKGDIRKATTRAIVVNDSELLMRNSYLQFSRGMIVNNSKLTIQGGGINNCDPRQNNYDKQFFYGGGLLARQGSSVILEQIPGVENSAPVIENNTANEGGGIAVGESENTNDKSVLNINDAVIKNNNTYGYGENDPKTIANEGGGIALVYNSNASAIINKATITGNKSNGDNNWGGGGIFASEGTFLWMPKGASIHDNTAGSLGGGLTACSTGKLYIDRKMHIYGNFANANGKHSSGDKPVDGEYYTTWNKNQGKMGNPGYKGEDIFSAMEAEVPGAYSTGTAANWTGIMDGTNFTNSKEAFLVTKEEWMLLKANPATTEGLGDQPVQIYSNSSVTHGGGVLINGYLITGDYTEDHIGDYLNLKGTKEFLDLEGSKKQQYDDQFKFGIYNQAGELVATATSDSNGNITSPDALYITSADTYGTKTYKYTFREIPDNLDGNIFPDQTVYDVEIQSETVNSGEYYKPKPVYVNNDPSQGIDHYVAEKVTIYRHYITKVRYKKSNENNWKEKVYPAQSSTKTVQIPENGITFQNREVSVQDIVVNKVWSGDTPPVDNIRVQLQRRTGKNEFQNYLAPVTLKASESWTYRWTDLHSMDGNENPFEYRIIELDALQGWESSLSQPVTTTETRINSDVTTTENVWVPAKEIQVDKDYKMVCITSGKVLGASLNNNKPQLSTVTIPSENILTDKDGRKVISGSFASGATITASMGAAEMQDSLASKEGTALRTTLTPHAWLYVSLRNTSGNLSVEWTNEYCAKLQSQGFKINNQGYLEGGISKGNFVGITYNGSFGTVESGSEPVQLFEMGTAQIPATSSRTVTVQTFTLTNVKPRYDLKIVKKDSEDSSKLLKGAEFELYKGSDKANLTKVGETVVTGDDGTVMFVGLEKGTYWLLETKQPDGYENPSSDFLEITIPDSSGNRTVEVSITNKLLIYELPETGSAGTKIYTATGTILLLTGTSLYRYKRRRRRKGGEAH